MLGGTLVTNGPLTLIQFPGIFIMLRQGDATGPSAGAIVNHFGFVYKDLAAVRARWKAAGVKFDVGETNPNQGYVYAPDSAIRVEVFGDPSLPGPVSMDHIHLYPPAADIPAMQAWYAKVFGGLPGKRQRVALPGLTDCDYFHRFNLSFSAGEGKLAPTGPRDRSPGLRREEPRRLREETRRAGPEVRGAAETGAEHADEGRVSHRSVGSLYRGHRAPRALTRTVRLRHRYCQCLN